MTLLNIFDHINNKSTMLFNFYLYLHKNLLNLNYVIYKFIFLISTMFIDYCGNCKNLYKNIVQRL